MRVLIWVERDMQVAPKSTLLPPERKIFGPFETREKAVIAAEIYRSIPKVVRAEVVIEPLEESLALLETTAMTPERRAELTRYYTDSAVNDGA